jgi:hypothetical protein
MKCGDVVLFEETLVCYACCPIVIKVYLVGKRW